MISIESDTKNSDMSVSHEFGDTIEANGFGFSQPDGTPSPSEDDESVKLFIGQVIILL